MADYKRTPGGWQCRVRVRDPRTGKLVTRKRTARRKSDLEIWAAETAMAIRGGKERTAALTVGDLMNPANSCRSRATRPRRS